MPTGSGSGIVHSDTCTPGAAGTLVVTITFDTQGTSGDNWGSSYRSRAFCTQDGATVYGDYLPISTTRGSQTIRAVFDVVAGEECEVGLYGSISGAVSADWWNVHVTAQLINS